MREKILVVNPPVLSPRPLPAMEGLMGPYVLASYLREEGKDTEVFDFIQEPRRLDGFEDVRVSGVKKCGNFEEERISKRNMMMYSERLTEKSLLKKSQPMSRRKSGNSHG